MRWLFLLLIFVFTLIGGLIPLWFKRMQSAVMVYLLAFTGAFLLGITLLHLVPESFEELGKVAGLFIFVGFFLQVFLQQWSHGMEHGHKVGEKAAQATSVGAFSIVVGLSVHAFMAGLPLGFTYEDPATLPALSIGILLHKIPEALTLMVMLIHLRKQAKGNLRLLILFALVTPLAACLVYFLNFEFAMMDIILAYVIAVVTGAFLHISTTIFFESGAQHHELNTGKIVSMLIGFCMAGLTLLLE
ncbi:MAG TPA: ZIP family metal transporter [Chitinophagaceae bacterium]|nr:ZIP family metal transporter [Chitinophagaceae bacterium]